MSTGRPPKSPQVTGAAAVQGGGGAVPRPLPREASPCPRLELSSQGVQGVTTRKAETRDGKGLSGSRWPTCPSSLCLGVWEAQIQQVLAEATRGEILFSSFFSVPVR